MNNKEEKIKKQDKNENISNEENELIDNIQENSKNEKQEEENKDGQFGKFKNPEQILKAYQELEKEFTKRSQKLKEFEMQSQNWNPSDDEWKQTVDKFFEKTPSAKTFAKDIAKELISNPDLKNDKNCLNFALTNVLLSKFRTPDELINDGQFLNDYILQSDNIKNAVINNYLKGLEEGMPPTTLYKSGEVSVASNKKPKSIEEAGKMFLKKNI